MAQSVNKIFLLQERAIRTICKQQYRNHTDPLFKKENILKLNDLYNLHGSLFMYDYRNSKLPISFHNFFVQSTHAINLRIIKQSIVKEHELNFPQNCLNTISLLFGIKAIPSQQIFKKTLMKLASNTYSENVHCDNIRCIQCHDK